jgi:hypothetical protein
MHWWEGVLLFNTTQAGNMTKMFSKFESWTVIVFCINTQYIFEETHLNVNDYKRAGSKKKRVK